MTTTLPLLCFNDVYRVTQRYVPQPGSPPESSPASSSKSISVSQFGHVLLQEREKWADSPSGDGAKEGLVLFAGDVFNPSVESSVTRGSHMVGYSIQIAKQLAHLERYRL
jgi:5'-nucleotidase